MLLLLVLPFVFYVSNSKAPRDHNVVDRVVVFISAPVQWLVVGTLDGIRSGWNRYVALVGVEAENERLREKVDRLEAELAARRELVHENERLRLLVGLDERNPDVDMQYARVIATAPTPLFRSVRVDRGSDDGVEAGDPVMTHQGIVGRVAAVSRHHADVMLMVDANSSTDVLVRRTRVRARVRGMGGDNRVAMRVKYLARTADVRPGDVLITSGIGGTFPKGLRVGTIVSVQRRRFGLYQKARVEPSVDFARLESVMVLASGWPDEASIEHPEAATDAAERAEPEAATDAAEQAEPAAATDAAEQAEPAAATDAAERAEPEAALRDALQ